jgi:hypothetical protein
MLQVILFCVVSYWDLRRPVMQFILNILSQNKINIYVLKLKGSSEMDVFELLVHTKFKLYTELTGRI